MIIDWIKKRRALHVERVLKGQAGKCLQHPEHSGKGWIHMPLLGRCVRMSRWEWVDPDNMPAEAVLVPPEIHAEVAATLPPRRAEHFVLVKVYSDGDEESDG